MRGPLSVKRLAVEALEPRWLLDGGLATLAPLPADTTDRFAFSGWAATSNPEPAGASVDASDVPLASCESTVLQYRFDGPPSLQAEAVGYSLVADDESSWCSPGEPIVPMRISRILLPEGTRIDTATVALGEPTVLARGIEMAAAPADTPIGEAAAAITTTTSESFFQPVSFETQFVRGYSVGVLRIVPVAFEADTGTLTYYDDIHVSVTTAPATAPDLLPLRHAEQDACLIADLVDNDSALAGYSTAEPAAASGELPAEGPFDYVIVAPEILADAMQPLVAHKQSRGLSATLVTTETIDAAYTSPYAHEDDLAGRVRAFLADAYQNWGTQWVVLAGDVDLPGSPIRNVTVSANGYEKTFPTDMYFACLDGPYNGVDDGQWGQANDGAFGGDVDRAPDVYVGRVPASNAAEATNFVNKTILYETTPPPNVDEALFLGEQLNSTPLWGAVSNEYLVERVVPDSYNVKTYYERDESYTRDDVIDKLNDTPSLVHHLGHSDYSFNAKLQCDNPPQLTNEHPYVLYSQGCLSGAFQLESMAEAHTVQSEHAAVAAIFNTDFGWYSSTGLGGSHLWAREFFDALFNENRVHVGEAHFDSKNDLASTSGTGRWIFFTSTLFGDPETPVAINPDEAPNKDLLGTSFAVSPDDLSEGEGTVEVSFSVSNGGLTATNPFSVRFYLSDDAQIDPATDTLLRLDGGGYHYRVGSGLPAQSTHADTLRLQVPDMSPPVDGQRTLGMVVDADDEVEEDDESNNRNRGIDLDLADLTIVGTATVIGRHVYYNNSAFDGRDAAAGASDDAAIAPDKTALLPGEVATFANYTSYARGINGIIIDLSDLPPGADLTAADFEFRVGNDGDPAGWAAAPLPEVSVRPGDGAYDSSRITLLWDDNQIENEWLRVVVKANQRTGLAEPDVFYFGNAVGETGDSPEHAMVTAGDEIFARHHSRIFEAAGIDDPSDFNRDRRVTAVDQILARRNASVFEALKLIAVPAEDVLSSTTVIHAVGQAETAQEPAAWLFDFEPLVEAEPSSTDDDQRRAIDLLLTIDQE